MHRPMTLEPTSLRDKVAWITGASRGLGRALAERCAAAGMRLALVSRSHLDALADSLPTEVLHAPLDVRDAEGVEAFAEAIIRRFGRLDLVINNAGVGWYKPFEKHSIAEIGLMVDINLKAAMFVAHAALPHLIESKGYLINIASDLARRPLANMAPYVATKHGLLGFSASLLREVRSQGVRVSTVCPGVIDTGFGDSEPDSRDPQWALRPAALAEVILHAVRQPATVVMDEIAVHPLGQDF